MTTAGLVAVALAVVLAFLVGLLSGSSPGLAGLTRYRKTLVTVAGTATTWAVATFPSNPQVQQWGGLAAALLTALGVYGVPNTPPPGEPGDPGMSEQGPA